MSENIKIMEMPKRPELDGLIDQDILNRFEGVSVFYGDIINAQLIKTTKELVEQLKKDTTK